MCEEKLVRVVASEVEEGGRINREREKRGWEGSQNNLSFFLILSLEANASSQLQLHQHWQLQRRIQQLPLNYVLQP